MPERLFPLLLGEAFMAAPPACRAMHAETSPSVAHGTSDVYRGTNPITKLIGWIAGMPTTGSAVPLSVTFLPQGDGVEIWVRNFGGRSFRSRLSRYGTRLREALFPLQLDFRLEAHTEGVVWHLERAALFGLIPLPSMLAPRVEAREWATNDRYHFVAEAHAPLFGRIVRYEGSLDPPVRIDPGR